MRPGADVSVFVGTEVGGESSFQKSENCSAYSSFFSFSLPIKDPTNLSGKKIFFLNKKNEKTSQKAKQKLNWPATTKAANMKTHKENLESIVEHI